MNLSDLIAISPVDGRYHSKTKELNVFFSEFALIKYRVFVEIEYFIALTQIPLPELKEFDTGFYPSLRKIFEDFQEVDARRIKEIEQTTNHDVKAVEYFLRERFDLLGLSKCKEFIHFGLTSQDINNTALPVSLQNALNKVLIPFYEQLISQLKTAAHDWKDITMLARTHGQPASPTRLGKEILVFVERLSLQLHQLKEIEISGKFGGATGNFNAHHIAYPSVDWIKFANELLEKQLNIKRQQVTTQIAHYDELSGVFDNLKRINTILIDFARDIWSYISMDYFKQQLKKGEIGSSAMPHKVNPIDFENAEGNLGIANALFDHLSQKLPISRLQRDLTDSTVIRNVGMPLAHSLIALTSLQKGFAKLIVNQKAIANDLENNWNVIAEAIQSVLRRENYPHPYEALRLLTRTNKKIDQQVFFEFIQKLEVSKEVKDELKKITPQNYTGITIK